MSQTVKRKHFLIGRFLIQTDFEISFLILIFERIFPLDDGKLEEFI